MKIDSTEGANMLNIQYGVAFGAIFSLSFSTGAATIQFAISDSNFLPFFGLIFYFFLDWITANFARDKFSFRDWTVYAWSLSIWWLGLVVVLINSSHSYRHFLLGGYVTVIGLFDLFGYKNVYYTVTLDRSLFWALLAGTKAIIGFVLLLQATPVVLGRGNGDMPLVAAALIWLLVLMKIARYQLIRRRAAAE